MGSYAASGPGRRLQHTEPMRRRQGWGAEATAGRHMDASVPSPHTPHPSPVVARLHDSLAIEHHVLHKLQMGAAGREHSGSEQGDKRQPRSGS